MSLSTQNDRNHPLKARKKRFLTVQETTLFAMFGSLMYCSKLLMEALPNIHPLAMFIVLLTVVYRKKALIPIYIYVFLNGLFAGFNLWWIPYLYIWTVLWGAAMLLPAELPKKAAVILYPILCFLHGILFGILYAPAQAMMFGLSFQKTLAWIAAGFPYDVLHGIGNFAFGLLVYPLSLLVRKLNRAIRI